MERVVPGNRRSQGSRLLNAHKGKDGGFPSRAAPAGSGGAYRPGPSFTSQLPFPIIKPSPMPSRPTSAGPGSEGRWKQYTSDAEGDDDQLVPDVGGHGLGSGSGAVTELGKRPPGGLTQLGGSEPKRPAMQTTVTSMFSQLDQRNQLARQAPAGMINLGNTCYLNSVLQVLLHMPGFATDLRSPRLERLRPLLPREGVWAGLRTTQDKLQRASQQQGTCSRLGGDHRPAVEPSELRGAMGRLGGGVKGERWRGFGQQDAHEFLVELLEALQGEVLAAEGASTGRKRMPLSRTRCPAARNVLGCLLHTWTCCACGRTSRGKELFSGLSLQLPNGAASVTLQSLIEDYLRDEVVDKNCDGCSPNAAVPHNQRHLLHRLPRVLVVHIKRFMPELLPVAQQPAQTSAPTSRAPSPAPAAAAAQVPDAMDVDSGQPTGTSRPSTPLPTTPEPTAAAVQEPAAAAAPFTSKPAEQPPVNATSEAAAAGAEPASGAGTAGGPSAAAAAGGPGGTPAPASSAPALGLAYTYRKLHTEVEVPSSLELRPHCDAQALASPHLWEGLSAEALSPLLRGPARPHDPGPPICKFFNRKSYILPACATPGPGGYTCDTAGGSTCPSPSISLAPSTVLQEKRQPPGGCTPFTDGRRAQHGNCPTPMDSAVSTGAHGGAREAPTPCGGLAPCGASPACTGRENLAPKWDTPAAGGGGSKGLGGGAGAAAEGPRTGDAAGQDGAACSGGRPNKAQRVGNGSSGPWGGGLRGGSGGFGEPAAGGGAAGDPLSSGRKVPRLVAASSFFGGAGQSGQTQLRLAAPGHRQSQYQLEGQGPIVPLKRICLEGAAGRDQSGGSDLPSGGGLLGGGTFRHAGQSSVQQQQQPRPSAQQLYDVNLPDLSEDEQLAMALQRSLEEQDGAPPFHSPGQGTGHGTDGGAKAGAGLRSGLAAHPLEGDVGGADLLESDEGDDGVGAAGGQGGAGVELELEYESPAARQPGSAGGSARRKARKAGNERSKKRQPPLGDAAGRAVNGHGADDDLSNDDDDFVDAVDGHAGVEAEGDGSGGSNDAGTGSEAERDYGRGHAHATGAHTASGRGVESAQTTGLVRKHISRVLKQRRIDKEKAMASGRKGAGVGADDTRLKPGIGAYLSQMRASPLAGQAGQGAGAGGGQFPDMPGVTRRDCISKPYKRAGRAPTVAPLQYSNKDAGKAKDGDSPELLSAGSGDGEGQAAIVAAGDGVGDGEEVNMGGGDGDGGEMDPELAEVLRASLVTYEAEERRRSGGHALGPSGPSGGGGGNLEDKWRAIQDLPDVGVAADGALRSAPAAVDAAGGGCRTPDHEPVRDVLVPPPSPVRPKSHTASKLKQGGVVVVTREPYPGRLRATVLDWGSAGANEQDRVDAPAPATDPRPADDLDPFDAGVSDRYGVSSSVGKKNKWADYLSGKVSLQEAATVALENLEGGGQLVGAWGQAAAASGGAGAGAGQATPVASVQPVAVDLTGQEDDEDKQLEQAILLSLQEMRPKLDAGQDVWEGEAEAIAASVGPGVLPAEAGVEAEPSGGPPHPQVHLVADSECDSADRDGWESGDDADACGPDQPQRAAPQAAGAAKGDAGVSESVAKRPQQQQTQQDCGALATGAAAAAGACPRPRLADLARYKLHGVVRHKGQTPFSGHYVADALVTLPPIANGATAGGQPSRRREWYEHNDSVVSARDPKRVQLDAAREGYLLFYVNTATLEAEARSAAAAAAAAVAAAVA